MELKVKKLDKNAIIPQYQSAGAACFDIHALTYMRKEITPGKAATLSTGLAFEVPEGFVLLVFSRSGHGFKDNIRLSNCVGVIDSDYRGELKVKLACDEGFGICVNHGDRIAQAMLLPVNQVQLLEVEELSETARGSAGFGSTGVSQ